MPNVMGAPNYMTLLAYDPTTHQYVPVAVQATQVDPYNNEPYATLQVGGTGGIANDLTIHDYTTTANHVKVNADGSLNVNNSSAVNTTALNDGTTVAQKLAIDINGRLGINNFPASQAISGAVSVSSLPALPAGTNVIGHVIVDSAGAVSITSLPTLPAGTNVIGHVIVDSAASVAITTLPALPTGSNAIGSVSVSNFPATQPVSGAVTVSNFPVTQPVSGSISVGNIPAVIVSGSAGAVSITNIAGSTITATTDYTITFSQQVNHLAIENNSTNVITWELDTATSATSLHLSNVNPGNILFLDVKATTVHVNSPAATSYGAASGINVRGWL